VVRGGSLVAWAVRPDPIRFRVVGGHTDSPNLRVKQHPDLAVAGWRMVALEPYGGVLLNSWLDRELGVSGRLAVREGAEVRELPVRVDEPVLIVPQLAIHLSADRAALTVDPQRHVNGVFGLGESLGDFLGFVAEWAGVERAAVLGFDLMTHPLAPSALVGGEFVAAPRLDNQVTCYAGLRALLAAVEQPGTSMPVLALFDHEEVGSTSDRGAQSDLLPTVLERIVLAAGGGRAEFLAALAGSICASGDMAHATHPNHPDRHEPSHRIVAGGGPVLKVNQNLRYATDATGAGTFALACADAGVPLQRYVHRADLPCGSTIGPTTAARTGMPTVDVGAPQLAMHSSRELMAAADIPRYARALEFFLRG
jgi:aspartyl aminopeptidase